MKNYSYLFYLFILLLEYPSDSEYTGQEPISPPGHDPTQPAAEQALKLTFSAAGMGGVRSQWEAVLYQNRLYVAVTQVNTGTGSTWQSLVYLPE